MLPKAGFRGGFTLSSPRARKSMSSSCRRRGLLLVSTWRGAPVLQHHPPALGLCLSLQWMQPSLGSELLSYGHFVFIHLVCVASRYFNTLCCL